MLKFKHLGNFERRAVEFDEGIVSSNSQILLKNSNLTDSAQLSKASRAVASTSSALSDISLTLRRAGYTSAEMIQKLEAENNKAEQEIRRRQQASKAGTESLASSANATSSNQAKSSASIPASRAYHKSPSASQTESKIVHSVARKSTASKATNSGNHAVTSSRPLIFESTSDAFSQNASNHTDASQNTRSTSIYLLIKQDILMKNDKHQHILHPNAEVHAYSVIQDGSQKYYVIRRDNQDFYLPADSKYIVNAYVQWHDIKPISRIKVIQPIHEYASQHSREPLKATFKVGATLSYARLAVVAKGKVTRFRLFDHHWITGNRKYIKII